ncbi:AlpA family phage regulatory protein [Amphritea atlantica]|uniref:AlpA family phage regulatory protein n=1 Tax=Amphritea atlantica TaxID=355243 RepID=A0ABY5GT11_9GAMM|nr:AlpA family phage regulatory protein [Amphritea atlantica]
MGITGLASSTVYKYCAENSFPRPVKGRFLSNGGTVFIFLGLLQPKLRVPFRILWFFTRQLQLSGIDRSTLIAVSLR